MRHGELTSLRVQVFKKYNTFNNVLSEMKFCCFLILLIGTGVLKFVTFQVEIKACTCFIKKKPEIFLL